MNENIQHTIVTFSTTSDAFALNQACKNTNVEGRLISVPRQLSAGCGTAWKSPINQKQALIDVINKQGLFYEEIHDMQLDW